MIHVNGIAEAVHIDRNAADVAVGNGENLLALLIVRLDVQSSVEMPGTRLAEVPRQHDAVIHRRLVVYIQITDRLGIVATACQQ